MSRRLVQRALVAASAFPVLVAAALTFSMHAAALHARAGQYQVEAGSNSLIVGNGVAEPVTAEEVISNLYLDGYFAPTLTDIVPEWSFVEAGSVVARMYTPWLTDEKAEKEQQLRSAEATARHTEAEAQTKMAELESALLVAKLNLREAEERLVALKALPTSYERERAFWGMEENEAGYTRACERVALLRELEEFGLSSALELAKADHERVERESEAAYLRAAFTELEEQGGSFEAQKAQIAVRKAALELQMAQVRKDLESKRQRLLCEAAQLVGLAEACRSLDLTKRRLDALTVRAPRTGYVVWGDRWDCWHIHRAGEKISRGKPIYFGQPILSIVDPSEVRISARVKEHEVLHVAVGDRAEVAFHAIPDKTYGGVVEAVLPTIRASQMELLETGSEALERYGIVRVRVAESDERVRPGMTAMVSIFPGSATQTDRSGRPAAETNALWLHRHEMPAASYRPRGLVLQGQLASRSRLYVRAPFQGRAVWLAAEGALVEAGDTVARLDPGLQEDWRGKDESELKRLELLRQAAELQVQLKERVAPLLIEVAQAEVSIAELSVLELESRPTLPEKIAVENELAEARWKRQEAEQQLQAYRRLASRGMASEADVRRCELQLACAEAAVTLAQANFDEVLRGASELEEAVAQANLKLSQTSLEKVKSQAQADIKVVKEELKAAVARLAAYREEGQRRLQKAEQAEVKSPVSGIVARRFVQEGQEVRAGWYIMEVADMEQAVVHAMLDETDYFRIPVGSKARVKLAGVPDRVFEGHVSGTADWPELPYWYRRRFAEGRVRPGKLFQVAVELEERPPTCVGMSAVVEIYPSPGVFRDGGRAGQQGGS